MVSSPVFVLAVEKSMSDLTKREDACRLILHLSNFNSIGSKIHRLKMQLTSIKTTTEKSVQYMTAMTLSAFAAYTILFTKMIHQQSAKKNRKIRS